MRHPLLLTLLLATVARALPTTQPVTGNLLPNPTLEQLADNHLPSHWTPFTAWGEGTATIDTQTTHTGHNSIRLEGIKPITQTFLRAPEMQVAPG
jgi:hypothetical protein